MNRSLYRYDADELHTIARRLEAETKSQRQELGRQLRLVADALNEIAEVDEGRGSAEKEAEHIGRALRWPKEEAA